MKFINRHKVILFLRIFFCGFLVTIWVFWLTNLPKPKKLLTEKVKQKVEDKKTTQNNDLQKENIGSKESKTQITFLGNEPEVIKSKKIIKSKEKPQLSIQDTNPKPTPKIEVKANVKAGLKPTPIASRTTPSSQVKIVAKPSPTTTPKIEVKVGLKPTPVTHSTTAVASPTPAITKKNGLIIKLPEIASATRKILLKTKPIINPKSINEDIGETTLRKEIHVDMTGQKPILPKALESSPQENTGESWLPKYVLETKELAQKVENTNNNLDQIANQLELTGLIEHPNGEKSAIFKNKLNNQTEILKQGQEYLNLRVTEITKEQVILENINLNKKYIKRLP